MTYEQGNNRYKRIYLRDNINTSKYIIQFVDKWSFNQGRVVGMKIEVVNHWLLETRQKGINNKGLIQNKIK